MSAPYESWHPRPLLTPEEAIARELIRERIEHAHRHRVERRHTRTAALLRRLAERLDPQPASWRENAPSRPSGIRPAGAC